MNIFNSKLSRQILIAYLLFFYILSGERGFLYFVDSRTYFDRVEYVIFLSAMFRFYPVWAAIHAALNLYIVYILVTKSKRFLSLFILSPYVLLILSNVTKEAYIFDGIILIFFSEKISKSRPIVLRVLRILGVALLAIRPIYYLMLLGGRRRLWFVFLGVALVLLAFPSVLQTATVAFNERAANRALVSHVGRSFFDYLCVPEKRDPMRFTTCVLPVFFLAPINSDTLSVLYIPYFLFQFPLLMVLKKMMLSGKVDFLFRSSIIFFLYLAIFFASPTFGAFVRYFYPVLLYSALAFYAPANRWR